MDTHVVRVKKDGVTLVETGPYDEDKAWRMRRDFTWIWPVNRSLPRWMWAYDEIVVDLWQPTLF